MYADNKAATRYLSQAMMYAPLDRDLTSQAIRSEVLDGHMAEAVTLAREKTALKVDVPAIHLVLFTEESRQGNWDLANNHLANIRTYGLQAVTLPFLKSWLTLAKEGKVVPPESALKLKHSFYQAFVQYQNALLYDVAGNSVNATQHYNEALADISIVPERFVSVAMQFFIRQNNVARAEEIYAAYQAANIGNLSLQSTPASLVITALEQTKKDMMIATPQDGIAEVMFTMASLLHSEMIDREALMYVRLALAMKSSFAEATYLLGEVLEDSDKKQEAMDAYAAIDKNHPLYRRAALRRAFLLDESDKTPQAMMLLQELSKQFKQPSDVYLTMGDILRNEKKYSDAVVSYTQAIDALGTIKPQFWPLFYTRGISYERAGQWEKAEADFLRALSLEPNQPDVKNYLAYSWILMKKNLDQAIDMLEQAAESRPEDGHIVDSLAWAYYVSGKTNKALDVIEMAIELMPHDPTVNDHYGDILWQKGRRTEARFQWERALAFHPDPQDKLVIEQKLRHGPVIQKTDAKRGTDARHSAISAQP